MMAEHTTSMNTKESINLWNNLDDQVKNHVNEFNEAILNFNDNEQSPNASEKRDQFITLINKISKHMNEITDDFNNLHTELIQREKDLNEQKCLCIPTSISGAFYVISGLNCCANVISSLGNILTFAGPTPQLRLTGLAVGLSADACSFVSDCALNLFYMQRDEISRIVKVNQAARDNALKFQGFLNELKIINEKQNRLLEALKNSNSLSYNEDTIDAGTNRVIDRKIRACVKKYENFPEQFRRTGVCGRLVLQIIEGFPPNDPLCNGLKKLAEIEDIRELPLHLERVSYINKFPNKGWTFEESPGEDSHSTVEDSHTNRRPTYTPQEVINYYINEIQTRFGLDEFSIDITKSTKGFEIKIEDPKEDDSISMLETPSIQAETMDRT